MSVMLFPVTLLERQIKNNRIQMKYPEVAGLGNPEIERKINEKIQDTVYKIIWNQGFEKDTALTVTGNTQITLNRAGVLSILLKMRFEGGLRAKGYLKTKTLTFNLQTGDVYKFEDLFQRNGDSINRINKIIKRQIVARDIPLLQKFKSVERDQKFYLTPQSLIVYFSHSEFTSNPFAILEFAIPYRELRDLAYEKGPLPKMETQKLAINEMDNGKTIPLAKNESLELALPTNPSTGYTWQFVQRPIPEVLRETRHFLIPQSQKPGAPAMEYWIFTAVGFGASTIVLQYSRSWSKEPPVKIFQANIIVG